MSVLIDNEAYTPSEPLPATVQELADLIRPGIAARKRIIISIRCDGEDVSEAELDRVLEQSPTTYRQLEFITLPLRELALSALAEARQSLEKTRPLQKEITEQLSQDKIEPAVANLADCIAHWSQAHEAMLKTIRLLNLNIEKLTFDGVAVVDIVHQVAGQLSQIRDCLTARDMILLNDLLQYELTPTFGQWEGMITALYKKIESESE